jgi:hypothetical protein
MLVACKQAWAMQVLWQLLPAQQAAEKAAPSSGGGAAVTTANAGQLGSQVGFRGRARCLNVQVRTCSVVSYHFVRHMLCVDQQAMVCILLHAIGSRVSTTCCLAQQRHVA